MLNTKFSYKRDDYLQNIDFDYKNYFYVNKSMNRWK